MAAPEPMGEAGMKLPDYGTEEYWDVVKADAYQLIAAFGRFFATGKLICNASGREVPDVKVGMGTAVCPGNGDHYHVFMNALSIIEGQDPCTVWVSRTPVPDKGTAQVYGLNVFEVAQGALEGMAGEPVLKMTQAPFTN